MNAKTICAGLALGTVMISSLAFAASGPFTKKQAEDGHLTFNNHCAECHRPNLKGGLGPALVDDKFKSHWTGKPITELRNFIYENMPQNAPKTIKDGDLNLILAWILSKNGVEPGDKELTKESSSAEFPKK